MNKQSDGLFLLAITLVLTNDWDKAVGQELASYKVQQIHSPIRSLTFTPTGETIAFCVGDAVELLDVSTAKRLEQFRPQCSAECLVFAPSGCTLAVGGLGYDPVNKTAVGKVIVWDLATRKQLALDGHTGRVDCVVFSPDGRALATGSLDRTVRLWDVASGRQRTWLKGRVDMVHDLFFSADGQTLAIAGEAGKGSVIEFWDVATSQLRTSLNGFLGPLAFAPDGSKLATNWGIIAHLDTANVHEQLRFDVGELSRVNCVAFAPDGKTVVTGGSGFDGPELRAWDTLTGRELGSLDIGFKVEQVGDALFRPAEVSSVAFSRDGKDLATAVVNAPHGGGEVRVWDWALVSRKKLLRPPDTQNRAQRIAELRRQRAEESKRRQTRPRAVTVKLCTNFERLPIELGIESVAFAPDGRVIATGCEDGVVRLRDVATGKELGRLDGAQGIIFSLAFSPDGKLLASGGTVLESNLKLWDVAQRRERLSLRGHDGPVRSIAFHANGKWLETASDDGTTRVWDVATGRQRDSGVPYTGDLREMTLSPDGKLRATSGFDDDAGMVIPEVRVWDTASGQLLARFARFGGPMAFSPDSETLAAWRGVITLLNTRTRKVAFDIRTDPEIRISSLAFSPDGNMLATGDQSSTGVARLRLWDTFSGKELANVESRDGVIHCVAFSPDGKVLASVGDRHGLKLWEVQPDDAETDE